MPTATIHSGGVKQTLVDSTTSSTLIYIGKNDRGIATSDNSWLISRVDKATGADIRYASAIADQIWDNRASLTYT